MPSETESPPPPPSSSIVPPQPAVPHSSASSSRKRRRAHSPSYTHHPSQVSLPETKSSPRRSIATIPSTVDMQNPTKGDIIQMETGSRKKFDGVVWRKICSLPDCFIAAQRNELCRKHFIKLNGKPHTLSTNDILGSISMVTPLSKSLSSMSTSSTDEKLGNVETLPLVRLSHSRSSQARTYRRRSKKSRSTTMKSSQPILCSISQVGPCVFCSRPFAQLNFSRRQ